jgi:hypothetical protein
MKSIIIPQDDYNDELLLARQKGYRSGYDSALNLIATIVFSNPDILDVENLMKTQPELLLFEGTFIRLIKALQK